MVVWNCIQNTYSFLKEDFQSMLVVHVFGCAWDRAWYAECPGAGVERRVERSFVVRIFWLLWGIGVHCRLVFQNHPFDNVFDSSSIDVRFVFVYRFYIPQILL